MYRIVKWVFFLFQPEFIHNIVAGSTRLIGYLPYMGSFLRKRYQLAHPSLVRTIAGIKFPNPVGLAAGFDKNASLFDRFFCFGFGFIEIGTLTPLAQPGNPKPRLFRLPMDGALINRLGFNNHGAHAAALRLKKFKRPGMIIGANIGRAKLTVNEDATTDYLTCYTLLYNYADYFTVNVSSPNTPGLRELQEKEPLTRLLVALQDLNQQQVHAKPIFLKIAPDLNFAELDIIIETVLSTRLAGIVACNTTVSRSGLRTTGSLAGQSGGLSGKPLAGRSTEIIRYLRSKLPQPIAIIGVGGIDSPNSALEKLEAGADLVQLYTGFIYKGPSLIRSINRALIH